MSAVHCRPAARSRQHPAALALAARRAGHDVVVATGADLVANVEKHGLAAWPVGLTHAEAGGGAATQWIEYFLATAEKRAVDLVPRTREWRPDLVISEETELAGPVAAATAGARRIIHGLGLMPPVRIWEAFGPTVERLHQQWDAPGAREVQLALPRRLPAVAAAHG